MKSSSKVKKFSHSPPGCSPPDPPTGHFRSGKEADGTDFFSCIPLSTPSNFRRSSQGVEPWTVKCIREYYVRSLYALPPRLEFYSDRSTFFVNMNLTAYCFFVSTVTGGNNKKGPFFKVDSAASSSARVRAAANGGSAIRFLLCVFLRNGCSSIFVRILTLCFLPRESACFAS